MEIILNVFQGFFNNVMSQPAWFMGLLVLVGYLLLNKPILDSISGALKAAIGYMILQVGSSGMVQGFNPILNGLLAKYQLEGAAVIDSNFGFAAANQAIEAMGESLASTMMVLLIGFSFNIVLLLLRRVTKIRTLYTTGHIMVKQAGFITYMIFFALPEARTTTVVLITGILIGIYWSVFSNLTVEATQDLTEGERVMAVGHSQMLGVWITDKVAHLFGNPEDSVESITLPKQLKAFSDNIFGTTIVMLVMFGTILFLLGPTTMSEFDPNVGGQAYVSYVLSKSLGFTASFIILQTGVRMFVSEITESFTGISNKLIKGAVPAVDCAATFGFSSSNTVTIGFLFGFLGQLLAILSLGLLNSPVLIITGFVPLFFDNGTLAVFANNKGGRKAAMIIPFISGMIQVYGGALGVMMFQLGSYGGWYGNLDVSTLWIALGGLIQQFAIPGAVIVGVLMLIIPQLQYNKNKETYF